MVVRLSLYTSQSPWWHSDCPFTQHSFPGVTQTIPTHITVSLVVLRVFLYSSQSPWLNSDYPYTHHSLTCCIQSIPILITVSLVVLSLSTYSSQSDLLYSEYPYTYHSLPGGTQSIHLLITVCLMVLRLSLYSPQSPWWSSDYFYTHHSLLDGTQTIPILITVSLVAFRLSLYSSQSTYWLRQSLYSSQFPWLYSDYTFTHHSLSGGPQTIPILITVYLVAQTISILITVSLVALRLSLYSSQTPWWYSDYPFTHLSFSGGAHTIPILTKIFLVSQTISILITVSLVVLRLSLYSSQSPLWYSDYPYTHHSLSGGTHSIPILTTVSLLVGQQSIPFHITFCLVVLRLTLYAS